MGQGILLLHVTTANEALPVANARVRIYQAGGNFLYEAVTDANGGTGQFILNAPDKRYTLNPDSFNNAYSLYSVVLSAEGFITEHIYGVEIVDTQTTVLPVHMMPIPDDPGPFANDYIYIPPVGLLLRQPYRKTNRPVRIHLNEVIIPDYITVHLGTPANTAARNVRVPFPEYIKNVTSSEIYSTWPQNSLIANIHAIVTFAINRVYTEWYPSRGYNFDITNSTSYDQYFREGGVIFENINQLVEGLFNIYAHRYGFANPFFTQFCNGTTSTCPGLSQWGTVTLANNGLTPLEILRYYYTPDLELTASNNIAGITESYPGYSLQLGSQGEPVQRIQSFLNRIRLNYPLIPNIANPNGTFDPDTQRAVMEFQRTFQLTQDGIVGRATWNRITSVYVAVTRLAELDSEGERIGIGRYPPNVTLSVGARGDDVLELQFILETVAQYFCTVPWVIMDGVFGYEVENAVIAFQRTFNLVPDGIVGPQTWDMLYNVYRGIEEAVTVP